MYTKTSIPFYSSLPNSLVVFVTLTKVKAVLNCSVVMFVVHDSPTSHSLCQHHAQKLYGGTVHVLMLEKAELIDGDIHQECSLARQLKSSTRKLASGYFCLKRKRRFLRNIC